MMSPKMPKKNSILSVTRKKKPNATSASATGIVKSMDGTSQISYPKPLLKKDKITFYRCSQ